MEILRAETGARTSIDPATVGSVRSPDDLRRAVVRAAGVPTESQILMLPSGAQVKEANLAELLSPGAQPAALLVFDRVLLGHHSVTPADLVRPLAVHPQFQPLQLPEVPRNASVADQCAAHSEHFRYHLQQLEHYSRAASTHVQQLLECLSEMRVQAMALSVALKNLDMHATSIVDPWKEFNSYAHRHIARHSSLLASFHHDMKLLELIHVNGRLVEVLRRQPDRHRVFDETPNGPHCLKEFVPAEKAVKWAASCNERHELLVQAVKDLAQAVGQVQLGTDEAKATPLPVDLSALEKLVAEARESEHALDTRRNVLMRDLTRVQDIVREFGGSHAPSRTSSRSSINVVTAAAGGIGTPPQNPSAGLQDQQSPGRIRHKLVAIEHLTQIHREDYLPEAAAFDRSIRTAVDAIAAAKLRLTEHLLAQLASVSDLSSNVAAIPLALKQLEEYIEEQVTDFRQLVHVNRMPAAYAACLVEICRRQQYKAVLLHQGERLGDGMNKIRAQEQRRREYFAQAISRYLPFSVPGLNEPIPDCKISVDNLQDSLPEVSESDVKYFEQEVSAIKAESRDAKDNIIADIVTRLQQSVAVVSSQKASLEEEFLRTISAALESSGEGCTGLRHDTLQTPPPDNRRVSEILDYENGVMTATPGDSPSETGSRGKSDFGMWTARCDELQRVLREESVMREKLEQELGGLKTHYMRCQEERRRLAAENKKLARELSHLPQREAKRRAQLQESSLASLKRAVDDRDRCARELEDARRRHELARQEDKEAVDKLRRMLADVRQERDELRTKLLAVCWGIPAV